MNLEGIQPLGVPEHTACTSVCRGQGHIGLLRGNGDADVLRLAAVVGNGVLVADLQVRPLTGRRLPAQTVHPAHGEFVGVQAGLVGDPTHDERLAVPENEAVLPFFNAVEVLIDDVKKGIVIHPHDNIRRAFALGTHLHDGVQQRVHGLADVVRPLRRAGLVAGAGIGVVQDQEIHASLVQQTHIVADGIGVGTAVVALRRLGPVVELPEIVVLFILCAEAVLGREPVLFCHFRHVRHIGHLPGSVTENRVEPHGIADTDKVVPVRDIQTQSISLLRCGSHDNLFHG